MSNEAHKPDVSEADLLSREAEDAKKAIFKTFDQLRDDIRHGVSPREITAKHPLIALGASALAGFVAASALTPAKDEVAKDKFAKFQAAILQKLTPHAGNEPSNGRAAEKEAKPVEPSSSLLGVLAREAIHLLKPALMSAIGAAITAKVTPAVNENDGVEQPQPQPEPY